jgi:hypothetical protein
MTASDCTFAYQATTKAKQAARIVTSLDNLANTAIQKSTPLKISSPQTNALPMPLPMQMPPLLVFASQTRLLHPPHPAAQTTVHAHPIG